MKIAVLAHLKFPIGQPFAGGLERHTHLLTEMLRARGHTVTLFAAKGSDPRLRPVEVCAPTGEGSGDPAHDARITEAEFAAYAGMMEAIASDRFDLVHNNSLHQLPLRLSRSIATPLVTVLHTPPFDSLADGVWSAGKEAVFAAVSPSLARQWHGLLPGVRVVDNGIDLAAFPFQPASNIRHEILWSGRIVPEKGLHLAIDAARQAGLPLAFAGPRNDVDYWRAEIAPRLGSDLTDLGHLGQCELAAQLGRARVALVTPRWEEPFGLVVAEALACGTPVAGFRRGALPDILDQASGRLARPDDVADLARAIVQAAPLDRRGCRKRAEALFDAHRMIDGYEALYRTALAGRLGRSRRPDAGGFGRDGTEA